VFGCLALNMGLFLLWLGAAPLSAIHGLHGIRPPRMAEDQQMQEQFPVAHPCAAPLSAIHGLHGISTSLCSAALGHPWPSRHKHILVQKKAPLLGRG